MMFSYVVFINQQHWWKQQHNPINKWQGFALHTGHGSITPVPSAPDKIITLIKYMHFSQKTQFFAQTQTHSAIVFPAKNCHCGKFALIWIRRQNFRVFTYKPRFFLPLKFVWLRTVFYFHKFIWCKCLEVKRERILPENPCVVHAMSPF